MFMIYHCLYVTNKGNVKQVTMCFFLLFLVLDIKHYQLQRIVITSDI